MLADTDIAPEGHDYSVERDIAGAVNKAYQYLDGHLRSVERIKPIQLVKMTFVCSAWYTTLVNAPTVWTDIDAPSFRGVRKRTMMVTEFLRRSQEAPVDLKLSIIQSRDPGIQAIVFNQLGSVRRLHLVNPTTALILGRDWMRVMQRPARYLELLELASTSLAHTWGASERVALPLDVFDGEAPRLRTLGLHLSVFHFNLNIRYSAFQNLENLDLGCLPTRIGSFTPGNALIRAASWNNIESPIEPVRCSLQRLELDFHSYSSASSTLSKADAVRVMSAVVQAPRLQHGIIEASAFGNYARSCTQLRHQDGRAWLFYDTSSAQILLPFRSMAECFGFGRRGGGGVRFPRSQTSSPSKYTCFHAPATTS
ncbi:hypothetical protein BKA62DRAFT_719655 [Auriculariales sp. MPI-PUGE-AT-0066]|nr:hypothetical protein BKA62DRAFT_719655 [Auriculariales sp. MPI-PUGE-AT-0066]